MFEFWFYLKKLWHEHILCDAFILTFINKIKLGEKLKTTGGRTFEVLWEEKSEKYYRYWVRDIRK